MNAGDDCHWHDTFEFAHHGRIALGGTKIVAGREEMAGVEADPDPFGVFDALKNGGELLEPVSDSRSLAGRRFQKDAAAIGGARAVDFVERSGDAPDAGLETVIQVGAGWTTRPETSNASQRSSSSVKPRTLLRRLFGSGEARLMR